MPVKKQPKTNKKPVVHIKEIDEEEEHKGKEKVLEKTDEILVRTIPEKPLSMITGISIPSYQHGRPFIFANHQLPRGFNPKPSNPVNTQKSSEAKNLKVKKITADSNIKNFVDNLKASLQNLSFTG